MSDTVSGGAALTKTKRVYLRSGTAYEGHAVCYRWQAVGVTAENDSVAALGTAITHWCDARQVMVDLPDYFNNLNFAGVVAKESDGVTGPDWITIHVPGSVCNIYTQAIASVGPLASCNNGQMLTFGFALDSSGVLTNQGDFMGQGFPGEGSAYVLAEGVASGLIMAKLCEGPPSGGYEEIAAVTATDMTASVIVGGVVAFVSAALDTGICSINIVDGQYIGQRSAFKYTFTAACENTIELVPASNIYVAGTSGVLATGTVAMGVMSTITFDANTDFALLEWAGANWIVQTNAQLSA